MKKFKITKKLLALILSLSLITGMMPAMAWNAFAADNQPRKLVDETLIFADLHAMYNGDSSTGEKGYKKDLVTNVMTKLKTEGFNFSSVTSAGDAFSSNESSYVGYTDTITGYIQAVLGNVPVNYVWSDHDRGALNNATEKKALDKTSRLVYGAGPNGNYGDADDANYYVYVLSMADLATWDRYGAGFYNSTEIANHIQAFESSAATLDKTKPLFIVGHQPLFDDRGDNGYAYQWVTAINRVAENMDVTYFHGHNHKYDDNAEAYFYEKNSTMSVPTTKVLSGSGYNTNLDEETVTLNFTHVNAGYLDPSTTGTQTGIVRQGTVMAVKIYNDSIQYITYDKDGVYDTGTAPINVTVDRAHAEKSEEPENPGETDIPDNDLIWAEIPGEQKTIFRLTDSLTANKKYVIVNKNTAGNANAINLNGSSINSTSVTVVADAAGNYIEAPATTAQWIYTSNKYLQSVSNTSAYLRGRSGTGTLRVGNSYGSYREWNYNSTYGLYGSNNSYNVNDAFSLVNRSNSNRVYLYEETQVETATRYAAMTGPTEFNITAGEYADDAAVKTMIQSKIDVLVGEQQNVSGAESTEDYTIEGTVDPAVAKDGGYELTVKYGGIILDTITVNVIVREATSISVEPTTFTVERGTAKTEKIGEITVTYNEGEPEIVDLTIGMLQGSLDVSKNGTYSNLSVTYGGKTVTGLTLNVINKSGNNYPEYPNEGAVKVNKTATGIDFQASGLAQVEVSASGVPIKKGADLIIMLDTSSSMTKNNVSGTDKTRATVLEESLADLITKLKSPGEDGELMDINVAIADFNGYYGDGSGGTTGTAYDRTSGDYVKNGNSNGSGYQQASEAKVYTGDNSLSAGAFVPASSLANSYTLNYTSGTNYDYAFDAIYQLGTAIKNANEEERDLYVIFMSDGASLQWNYFGTQNTYTKWNNWLSGAWDADDLTTSNLNSTKHSYFYDLNDHDNDGHINEHRMANAIKGNPDHNYEVIRKSTAGLPAGTLTAVDGKEYMYTVPGLGATMFTINFDAQQDGQITVDNIDKALQSTASDQTGTTQYYYKVTTADALSHAFDAIGSEIAYAATNARYVDKMGESFNLQLKAHTYITSDGTSKTVNPKIEIISYDIYTKEDAKAGRIPEGKNIGDRKGTSKVLETVTFSADGTKAYSDQIGSNVNILADGSDSNFVKGVIYAKTFIFNTNALDVAVDGVNIPTSNGSTNVLPSETFYWKMGTVQSSELAMRYYLYLDGSLEGTKEAGSYATNEYAVLYYDNYIGNACQKPTVSPTVAWKSANVSYAFYLVNEKGEIVVNQTTGQTGSFANKVAVTNPVVYKEILLNNTSQVQAIDIAAIEDNVLPKYYELYDSKAKYTVQINSNATGNWVIEKGNVTANSTYVTHYKTDDPSGYSNALTNNTAGDDYTHTIVWFAVVWKVQAHPDAVVVDYGLPVDISVLSNDMFGDYGKLAGIGAYSDNLNLDGHDKTNALTGTEYKGTYGTATANTTTGKVRYTPNTMEMDGYDKFAYAVNYTGTTNPGYYYDTVTVIPATSIYYEDDFMTYTAKNTEWVDEGTKVEGVTQDEDRPGQYSLTDANNIYGYDSVNKGMSTFSLGSAKKVHVDADSYATAEFSFCGTGFDVVGMTSNKTGVLTLKVYKDGETATTLTKAVDTYYGYTYTEDKKWVETPDVSNALYQVPVMQVEDLEYGHYTVVLTAAHYGALDKTSDDGYDLYLDAIRIYDPANDGNVDGSTDTTIEDAYKADGEGWPSYIELRNKLIAANSFGNELASTKVEGLVFIDGGVPVEITDYQNYGPNNEVYLAPGQSVAFILETPDNFNKVHLGIKSADGNTGTYTITNIAQYDNNVTGVQAGEVYGTKISTIDTSTDMYYNITGYKNDIIVISNTGDEGIISLTNIKSTYTSDPNGNETTNISDTSGPSKAVSAEPRETSIYMTPAAAALTLRSLNTPVVPDEPETPDVPDTPVTPENPDTPVEPDTPGEPENPDTPVVPDTPVTPEEPEEDKPVVEEPEKPVVTAAKIISVKTDKKTYTQGDKVKVTVTTNSAATKVKIGTKTLKTFKTTKGNRTWTTTVKASKIGKLSIGAVAYNKKGTATKKVIKKVTVKRFVPKTFNVKLSKSKVKVGAKYTVTVKAGTAVKYVKVNGKKITKYTYNKKAKTRTFKITYKAAKAGKKTVKVVAYNKAGYASKAKTKTVTVKKK